MNLGCETGAIKRLKGARWRTPKPAIQPLGTMTTVSDAGNRIRQYRKGAGLTITELAHQADVDPGRLAGMEDGSVSPTQYECGALERSLPGCSPQELGLLVYGDTYRGVPGFDATIDET